MNLTLSQNTTTIFLKCVIHLAANECVMAASTVKGMQRKASRYIPYFDHRYDVYAGRAMTECSL